MFKPSFHDKNKYQSSYDQGFTLLELIVVIVVIAILATVAIVSYAGINNRAKDTQVEANVATLLKKLEIHRQTSGSYPSNNCGLLANPTFSDANVAPDLLHNPYSKGSFLDATNNCQTEYSENFTTAGNIGDFSDIDSFMSALASAQSSFVQSYIIDHPIDGYETWTEQRQIEYQNQLESAFLSVYPEFSCAFQDACVEPGTHIKIDDVPVEWRYIVSYLVPEEQQHKCRSPKYTGVKIEYYSKVADEWKSRSVGSGVKYQPHC